MGWIREHETGFLVYQKRCKNCLFSGNRIVSEARAAEIVQTCKETDTYFICHVEQANQMRQREVCCRGFYDQATDPESPLFGVGQSIRIAKALNVVRFVDLPDTPDLNKFRLFE